MNLPNAILPAVPMPAETSDADVDGKGKGKGKGKKGKETGAGDNPRKKKDEQLFLHLGVSGAVHVAHMCNKKPEYVESKSNAE